MSYINTSDIADLHRYQNVHDDSSVVWLEKAQSGKVSLDDIQEALAEFTKLFKAGMASKAETLTLARAFPDSPAYTEAARNQSEQDNDHEPLVIGGPASISLVDREGHLITTGALKRAFQKFMNNDRTRNVMVLHSDVQIGWALPAYISKGGQIFKSGVDDKGLFFICELRDDTSIAAKVADQIKKGQLKSYSIAGSATSVKNMTKGLTPYLQVDDMELAEVTVCEKGVNQGASFEILKAEQSPLQPYAAKFVRKPEPESKPEPQWAESDNPPGGLDRHAKTPLKDKMIMHSNDDGTINFNKSFAYWMQKEKDPLTSKESFATLNNEAGRQAEHAQLLREYGFPSAQPVESMRYVPVVETETDDDGIPIHNLPPWVVNEAGEALGDRLDEDSPGYKKSDKAKARQKAGTAQKMFLDFMEKDDMPKGKAQLPGGKKNYGLNPKGGKGRKGTASTTIRPYMQPKVEPKPEEETIETMMEFDVPSPGGGGKAGKRINQPPRPYGNPGPQPQPQKKSLEHFLKIMTSPGSVSGGQFGADKTVGSIGIGNPNKGIKRVDSSATGQTEWDIEKATPRRRQFPVEVPPRVRPMMSEGRIRGTPATQTHEVRPEPTRGPGGFSSEGDRRAAMVAERRRNAERNRNAESPSPEAPSPETPAPPGTSTFGPPTGGGGTVDTGRGRGGRLIDRLKRGYKDVVGSRAMQGIGRGARESWAGITGSDKGVGMRTDPTTGKKTRGGLAYSAGRGARRLGQGVKEGYRDYDPTTDSFKPSDRKLQSGKEPSMMRQVGRLFGRGGRQGAQAVGGAARGLAGTDQGGQGAAGRGGYRVGQYGQSAVDALSRGVAGGVRGLMPGQVGRNLREQGSDLGLAGGYGQGLGQGGRAAAAGITDFIGEHAPGIGAGARRGRQERANTENMHTEHGWTEGRTVSHPANRSMSHADQRGRTNEMLSTGRGNKSLGDWMGMHEHLLRHNETGEKVAHMSFTPPEGMNIHSQIDAHQFAQIAHPDAGHIQYTGAGQYQNHSGIHAHVNNVLQGMTDASSMPNHIQPQSQAIDSRTQDVPRMIPNPAHPENAGGGTGISPNDPGMQYIQGQMQAQRQPSVAGPQRFTRGGPAAGNQAAWSGSPVSGPPQPTPAQPISSTPNLSRDWAKPQPVTNSLNKMLRKAFRSKPRRYNKTWESNLW